VTRKEDEFALYWRETMIQSGCVLALVASIIYSFTESPKHFTIDAWSHLLGVFLLTPPGRIRSQVMVRHLVAPKEGTNDRGAAHDSGGAGQRPREWSRSRALRSSPVGPASTGGPANSWSSPPGRRRSTAARRQPDFLPVRHPLRTLEPAPRLVARSTWTSHFS